MQDELPRIFGSLSLEQTELGVSLLLAGIGLASFAYSTVTAGAHLVSVVHTFVSQHSHRGLKGFLRASILSGDT